MPRLEDGSTRGDGAEGDELAVRTTDETSETVYVLLDHPYPPSFISLLSCIFFLQPAAPSGKGCWSCSSTGVLFFTDRVEAHVYEAVCVASELSSII